MYEIKNNAFYDYIKQYDPDPEYHFVGEVDYHLLKDDKPYEGVQSHREALTAVFDRLAENSIEDQKSIREIFKESEKEYSSQSVAIVSKIKAEKSCQGISV